MNMQLSSIVRGTLTFIPGIRRIVPGIGVGTGGTDSAAYCYGVWLKHLTLLHANGMKEMPRTIAELGPGDSLGIGLAAMLSGVDHYCALDVVRHAQDGRDLAIFDELVDLFRQRAPRPTRGWPDFDAHLDEDLFPGGILNEGVLARALAPERIENLRALVQGRTAETDVSIRYMVPWDDDGVIEPATVDLIISHSVLEHVVDLKKTYRAMHAWLKPGAWMSHQIDFTSHGLAREWNGHRQYPELIWKLVEGNRPYLLNRQPYSTHQRLLQEQQLDVVCDLRNHISTSGLRRDQLARRWREISDEDLTCAGAFVQARRALPSVNGCESGVGHQ